MSTLQDLSKVLSRKQAILEESAAGVEQQKKSGKQAARERIALLLDGGSFVEQSMLAQDAGVVAGSGTVDGRPVFVFAQDFAVMDGAMGAKQAKKIVKILEQARKTGTPVVAMCDSNGARVGEGAAALEAYADVFAHMARLSGVVPMISLVLGPCVGAAAMMAKLSDVVIVSKPAGALMMAGPAGAGFRHEEGRQGRGARRRGRGGEDRRGAFRLRERGGRDGQGQGRAGHAAGEQP